MTIHYDVTAQVAIITIDRPEKRNALTFAMVREFFDAVEEAGSDDRVRAVIITGVPGSFCAGADLSTVSTVLDEVHEETDRGDVLAGLDKLYPWNITECPKPVIAAIDGPAVGMGAEFTSHCDFRLATPQARFAWNFVNRGSIADSGAGTWLLPRLIGLPAALRLLYTGSFLSAQQAFELGYVEEVVDSEQLPDRALELAASMTSGSPVAVRLTKDLVYRGLGRTLEEHFAHQDEAMSLCFHSEDHREGVAAFMEKRQPRFVGR